MTSGTGVQLDFTHAIHFFTRVQILLIVAGMAIVVVVVNRFFEITVGSRLRKWAESQGYEFQDWEWPPFAGWDRSSCYFTVLDQAGNRKWGRANLTGAEVKVEWVESRDHTPVSRTLRVIVVILGLAAVVMLVDLLFG